jgi:murein DD-endopeptidase MepM/ murein hydrolase activator NlpD
MDEAMIDSMAGIGALGSLATPTHEVDKNAKPGEEMEVLFAKILLKEVRKSLPEDSLMSGPALDMFQDLFDDALAEQFAAAGGFGIAEQLATRPTAPGIATPHTGWASPVAGYRSSNFGARIDPITGSHRNHDGIDIAAPTGTAIQAARQGEVIFSGKKGGYGNLVIVDHGNGLQSRYAHCNQLLAPVGRHVDAGEVIATVGSTGRSTGSHLHFEIRQDGRPVDPDQHLE